MTITSTNTLTTDISYSASEVNGNTQRSENDSLGYSVSFTEGTGLGQVNARVKNTGIIASGQTLIIDFENITKETFGSSYAINFQKVKSFVFYNESTGITDKVYVRATGASAITGFFNGGSGNVIINPYGSYVYSNYYGDVESNASHRYLSFVNASTETGTSGNLEYSYILIGVTG